MAPTTREQRIAFTAHVKNLLWEQCDWPDLVRLGAASSALETGWGAHVLGNNLFGIKPVGNQPHVPGRREIRAFPDERRSVYSWLYLAQKSSLYKAPRERLITHLAEFQQTGAEAIMYRSAWGCWMLDFARIFCPVNPSYGVLVLQIANEQDLMQQEGE